MVVLLVPASAKVSLGPEVARGLAASGVTHATLLRDGESVAVVLEGWAFDPRTGSSAVAELVTSGSPCRTFHALADITVSRETGRADAGADGASRDDGGRSS